MSYKKIYIFTIFYKDYLSNVDNPPYESYQILSFSKEVDFSPYKFSYVELNIENYLYERLKERYYNNSTSVKINHVLQMCIDEINNKTPISSKYEPTTIQVGGDHYKNFSIQPIEYIFKNNLGYFEGNVLKYITRWKKKGGVEDLKKARDYLDKLISFQ